MNREADVRSTSRPHETKPARSAARRFLASRRAVEAVADEGATVEGLRWQVAAMESAARLGANIAECMDGETADEIRRHIAEARRRR